MVSPNKTVHVETILGWLKESEKIEEEKSEEYALFAIMSDRDRLNILSFIDYRKLLYMKHQTPSQDKPNNMENKLVSLNDIFGIGKNDPMSQFHSAPRGRGKIIKPTLKKSEWSEQLTLCKWLNKDYPEVRFRSDIQSAGKLSPQMQNITQILDPFRGWPDIMIFHGSGLGIEMKRKDSGTFLKDGSLSSNKHVQEQNKMHVFLRSIGWEVHFAEGAEKAMEIVKEYLR